MGKIRAITFDLWDTVIIDESDEPKRANLGMLPKPKERRRLVHEYLNKHEPISRAMVDLAYDTADAAFRLVWYGQSVTWSVRERLTVVLNGLKRELPAAELDELVRLHEDMELGVQPDLAPGIVEAIKAASETYKLGVLSDTIFSPGRALRELLAGHGLLEYFDAFVFSDEIGCAKPDPRAFKAAADQLGVALTEIVHIGDRDKKDIQGPHGVGAKGIYSTVVKDRGSATTTADAICRDYRDLVSIVDGLNS